MKNLKKKAFFSPLVITLLILMILYVISFVYPILWALSTSFKNMEFWMMEMNPNALPPSLDFSNYVTVVKELTVQTTVAGKGYRDVAIPEMFFNTVVYVFGTAFFSTLAPCVVGYAAGRFNFKFNSVLTGTVIVSMTLPIVGSTPSMLRIVKLLGLFDNQIGPWIMGMSYLGMYYLIFHSFFKGVPKEYSEAAQIDGASNLRIFLLIILPMAAGTFLTVFLLQCISLWNNYQTTLMYMPSYPTLALGLYFFKFGGQTIYTEPPYEMAGALLLAIPVVVVFAIFSDRIMGKVSMGGIKG